MRKRSEVKFINYSVLKFQSLTGPVTWMGHEGDTYVVLLGKEYHGEAHSSPGLQLVWTQSFLSLRLVVTPRLKSSECQTIHLELEEEQLVSYLYQEY